jgi:hypothetical protein
MDVRKWTDPAPKADSTVYLPDLRVPFKKKKLGMYLA